MAKQVKVYTGTQWDTLAVTLPDLSNYSTTTQMNTAIDNAKGLVYITGSTFSSAASVTIDNCFSSTYDNYQIELHVTANSTTDAELRPYFRSSAPADLTSDNGFIWIAGYGSSNAFSSGSSTSFGQPLMAFSSADTCIYSITVQNPLATSAKKNMVAQMNGIGRVTGSNQYLIQQIGMRNNTATAATGIKFSVSTGNFSGNIKIYGLRNS